MQNIAIYLINFYRNYLSIYKLHTCRFYPTCSEYAIGAIQKKGILRGLFFSAIRIIRCNSFNKGGYDPV